MKRRGKKKYNICRNSHILLRNKYAISEDNKISEVEENSNISKHYINNPTMNAYNEKIYETKTGSTHTYQPAIVDINRPEDGATIYRTHQYNNPLEVIVLK